MHLETRKRVRILGITQGVGFRPFVFRLAERCGLTGWVQNDSAGLLCEIQGSPAAVDAFLAELEAAPPPLARLDSIEETQLPSVAAESAFVIRTSQEQHGESNPVTQDISICADCRRELTTAGDRRFRYPFINCTNCGPRFTIIEDLPYDRPATTMKSFAMCGRCQAEYDDPENRRFHAQPNACGDCGPAVWFSTGEQVRSSCPSPRDSDATGQDAIHKFVAAVSQGEIVATKGIGGFHLVCDAANAAAIARLRERKGRVDKPLAVMAFDVVQAREFALVGEQEQQLLESQERPIVLLEKRRSVQHAELLDAVAPGNDFVGVMLPYSPLHYLLVDGVSPLVVTSGNISDEPIVRTNQEASTRLARLADSFLFHNRDIRVVCDDSVVRCVEGRLLPIRRSRGYAPLPVRLQEAGPSVFAAGGEIKATFCVTKGNYATMSQHIGDVGNIETLEALERNVEHFLKLFRIDVEAVAGDLHPDYLSSRWARELAAKLSVPYLPVQHHYAHAASLVAEHEHEHPGASIACCFDGTGYGTDGAIWGGEFLVIGRRDFQRPAHLRYFPLPGGDASIKRPYRAALALLWQHGVEWDERLPSVGACPSGQRQLLGRQLEANLNCAATSSMGRLFDAVASLIGIRHEISYEAQAAMEMETLAAAAIDEVEPGAYSFELIESDAIEVGCGSVLKAVCEDVLAGTERRLIAARFHRALAAMVGAVSVRIRAATGLDRVGLTGGVFQNALLLKLTVEELTRNRFDVWTHSVVPPNDGGLALGQAVVARNALIEENAD